MPIKPRYVTVYLLSHHDPDLCHGINIDYYATLKKTLDILSREYPRYRPKSLVNIPDKLYNKYDQEVPLHYNVPKDLEFYIERSTDKKQTRKYVNNSRNTGTNTYKNKWKSRSKYEYKKKNDTPTECLLSDSD
jgi:hypothetical protein